MQFCFVLELIHKLLLLRLQTRSDLDPSMCYDISGVNQRMLQILEEI